MMTPQEVMEAIVRALDSKKARDITVLKTEQVSVLADYFVICTAGSTTQIKTLSDETGKALSDLFLQETRQFYDLERLWSDAPRVDIAHLLTE